MIRPGCVDGGSHKESDPQRHASRILTPTQVTDLIQTTTQPDLAALSVPDRPVPVSPKPWP